MIPLSSTKFENGVEIRAEPSLSYKIKLEKERIEKNIDGIEAVKQSIYKMLMTDRYKYEIYDWNYGVELNDLIGKNKEYVKTELARRIPEALTVDDRIKEVTDFAFTEVDKTTLAVSFVVATIFGDTYIQTEVNI